MTHNLIEQFRGKGVAGGGYVSGLTFKDLEGHQIVKWLRDQGYEARAVGGERYACGQTSCGMRLYSNGYVCDADDKKLVTDDETLKASKYTKPKAIQFEAQAHDKFKATQDSFERCDTDGFLSQYASNLTAELLLAQAEIAENDGLSYFPRLWDVAEDREINAKLVDSKYGMVWLVDDEDTHLFNGRKFIPFAGRGVSRIQNQWGLVEKDVLKPAHAVIGGKGTGLSGSAWVEVVEVKEVYEIYKDGE